MRKTAVPTVSSIQSRPQTGASSSRPLLLKTLTTPAGLGPAASAVRTGSRSLGRGGTVQ